SNGSESEELFYTVNAPSWIKVNEAYTEADGYDNGFGYAFGKADYNWIDISETGTSLKEHFDYDIYFTPVELEHFTFNWYGEEFSEINLSKSGFLTFDMDASASLGRSPYNYLPYTWNGVSLLSAFWGWNMVVTWDDADLLIHQSEEHVIIQWERINSRAQLRQDFTFQMILYPDGRVKYQYKSLDRNQAYFPHTIGFQNQGGEYGVMMIDDTTVDPANHNETAYMITPPLMGKLQPGESTTVDIQYTARDMAVGDYTGHVNVATNDVNNELQAFPVALSVTGEPVISINRQLIEFEALTYLESGDAQTMEMISIINEGSQPVAVLDINTIGEAGYFGNDLSTGAIIPAFGQFDFTLYYNALDADEHTAIMTISIEEAGDFDVTMVGNAVLPASFSYDAGSSSENDVLTWIVNENKTEAFDITLSNEGAEEAMSFDITLGIAHQGWNQVETPVEPEQHAVLKAAVQAPTKLKELNSIPFSSVATESATQLKAAMRTPHVFADSIAYDDASDIPWALYGSAEMQLKTATQFTVLQEEGFYLTHVNQFIRREEVNEPFIIQVLQGPDVANSQVLLSQEYYGQSAEGAMETIALDEQFYFESGSVFYIRIIYPMGITHALGVDANMPSVIGKYFVSFDDTDDWYAISDIWYYTYTFKTRAMSSNPNQWLSINPSFGSIESAGEQKVSFEINADKLNAGSYESYLHMAHNDPYKSNLRLPVLIRVNQAPIAGLPEQYTMYENETMTLSVPISDPEMDAISKIKWDQEHAFIGGSYADGVLALSLTPSFDMAGTYTYEVELSDEHGANATYSMAVEVKDVNRAPEVVTPIEDRQYYDNGDYEEIDLSNVFVDPDGDALSYSVMVENDELVKAFISTSSIALETLKPGETSITITAYDEHGLSAEHSFIVRIETPTNIDNILSSDIQVYPIPATDEIHVEIGSAIQGDFKLAIIGVDGSVKLMQELIKESAMQTFPINISQLKPGVYFIHISSGGIEVVKRMVKK
ncbi:MAG: T9SS type A sorting domain-containing protein, partial [Bacteroidales bacterium]|nr:T9SS type A sorting domain-containing protein [Bacteroidales bacterium]